VPFNIVGDGNSTAWDLSTILDNLIQQRRVPSMVAILIGNGGRMPRAPSAGKYDTVSHAAQFVEREVLPLVEQRANAKDHDPDGGATMGASSSGAAAFTMAWFILSLSPGAGIADHGEPAMAWDLYCQRRRLGVPAPGPPPAAPT
jgi:enterochelin esterase-like enzyme